MVCERTRPGDGLVGGMHAAVCRFPPMSWLGEKCMKPGIVTKLLTSDSSCSIICMCSAIRFASAVRKIAAILCFSGLSFGWDSCHFGQR
jgi:hypothetical protein